MFGDLHGRAIGSPDESVTLCGRSAEAVSGAQWAKLGHRDESADLPVFRGVIANWERNWERILHPAKPGRVTVAGKLSAVLPPGTERSILRQAGLNRRIS